MNDQARRTAFFDVDETLITVKSMFRFLRFHLRAQGAPDSAYEEAAGNLRRRAAEGVPREVTNREYYGLYAGCSVEEVAREGRAWFAQELAAGGLFHPPVLDALREHRSAGDRTVLVSGSFPACLDPVAAHVGADAVLCSRPEIKDGRYTGELTVAVIGEAKAVAAEADMRDTGADPADCHAYGDHASDLPLLTAVGHAHVIGDDPVLAERGADSGWHRLKGIAGRTPATAAAPAITVAASAAPAGDPLGELARLSGLPGTPEQPEWRTGAELLLRYLGRAAAMVADGYAAPEDIDTAMRLGCGMRGGPLELLDSIGPHTAQAAAEALGLPAGAFARLGRAPVAAAPASHAAGIGPRTVRDVGVVGSGTMATGIAAVFLASGHPVRLLARSEQRAEAARLAVHRALLSTRMPRDEADRVLEGCVTVLSADALAGCDLVVEAIAEDLDAKLDVLTRLDRACGPGTVLATTTSSLPVARLASAVSRPADVIGLHFFNPAPAMTLVEVVRTDTTAAEVIATADALCRALGRTPVHCTDRAGFIVNALLFPLLNDAARVVGEGRGTVEEVDAAVTGGCGFPHGPFRLLDVVGTDVALAVQQGLRRGLGGSELDVAPLLEELVRDGVLGMKARRSVRQHLRPA
ncbi:HAD-IB family hydrolase [Streptomyces sp. MB09-01]|uniref:HAD-IB family hydrolase n=1 Tax=Streptomyces sp. MB09-01 TaxID=3028666 RepID=UPI0029B7C7D7|nr:HAD-IB family hydrolase [Streptomyces sp. MB09-01]MDX3537098.1 HAD-IB family hydrolase [Streptomyces sp. MB09-01]